MLWENPFLSWWRLIDNMKTRAITGILNSRADKRGSNKTKADWFNKDNKNTIGFWLNHA